MVSMGFFSFVVCKCDVLITSKIWSENFPSISTPDNTLLSVRKQGKLLLSMAAQPCYKTLYLCSWNEKNEAHFAACSISSLAWGWALGEDLDGGMKYCDIIWHLSNKPSDLGTNPYANIGASYRIRIALNLLKFPQSSPCRTDGISKVVGLHACFMSCLLCRIRWLLD